MPRFQVVESVLNSVTVYFVQDTGVDSEIPVYAGVFGTLGAAQNYANWLNA